MQGNLTMDRLAEMRGQPVYDKAGDKIGSVDEIFYDEQTNRPEWIGIGTGFFGTKRVLVPIAGASVSPDGISVRYDKEHVKDSPDVDSDEISERMERKLYSYYGLQATERVSEDVLPQGSRGTKGTAKESLTRKEEQLKVGKREEAAGRARLRKWVETEPVQIDVDLKRETARVTREQIDEPVSDAPLGKEEVEVELRREEPVVEKQTVAKERVGIEKNVETERHKVTDKVRKEHVDVEGDLDEHS